VESGQTPLPSDSGRTVLSTRYTYEWVSDLQNWHTRSLTLETPLPVGTVVGTLTQQRRFGEDDLSGGLQYWTELWGDSYGQMRVALAPDALTMARRRIGGALYEVVNAWEFSGQFEWRRYAGTNVYVMGPQIARYVGPWYLRLQTTLVEREGHWSAMQRAAARYYPGSADSYVEGQVGYGRTVEIEDARPTVPLEDTQSYVGSVRLHHFFSTHAGVSASATYSNAIRQRTGASIGLLVRW
jgi:YaiO family outer membrane protein